MNHRRMFRTIHVEITGGISIVLVKDSKNIQSTIPSEIVRYFLQGYLLEFLEKPPETFLYESWDEFLTVFLKDIVEEFL